MSTESILEQYKIHDFLDWNDKKTLVINRDFQRREVWAPTAKIMLIDSILRGMPMPKIYLRTRLDLTTKSSIREIVDGQQRLKAIFEFARDGLRLSARAVEFSGMRYSDLDEDHQSRFLTYPIAVDQLVNADDTDVLSVFARLNSYTVSLSPAERRHAKYQGDFKWEVVSAAEKWRILWDVLKIVQGRDRLRMKDDELMAEIYGVAIDGLQDGGGKYIDDLYARFDDGIPDLERVRSVVNASLEFVAQHFGDVILDSEIRRTTQFLMLVAAHMQLAKDKVQVDADIARERLQEIAEALDGDSRTSARFQDFLSASRGSTQRISTRRVRFATYLGALSPESVGGIEI